MPATRTSTPLPSSPSHSSRATSPSWWTPRPRSGGCRLSVRPSLGLGTLGARGWCSGVPPSFPSDLLLTSSSGELWRMVRIGGQPLGFGECGRGAAGW